MYLKCVVLFSILDFLADYWWTFVIFLCVIPLIWILCVIHGKHKRTREENVWLIEQSYSTKIKKEMERLQNEKERLEKSSSKFIPANADNKELLKLQKEKANAKNQIDAEAADIRIRQEQARLDELNKMYKDQEKFIHSQLLAVEEKINLLNEGYIDGYKIQIMDDCTRISMRLKRYDRVNDRYHSGWYNRKFRVSYIASGKSKLMGLKYDKEKDMYILDETIPYVPFVDYYRNDNSYIEFTYAIVDKDEYDDSFSVHNSYSKKLVIKRFPDRPDIGYFEVHDLDQE